MATMRLSSSGAGSQFDAAAGTATMAVARNTAFLIMKKPPVSNR
jgi:hypothetical protein